MPCETAASWSDVCAPLSSPQSACHSPFLPLARPLTFQKATSTDSPAPAHPFYSFLFSPSRTISSLPAVTHDSFYIILSVILPADPSLTLSAPVSPSTMSIRSLLCASPSAETFGLLTPCFSLLSSTHSTVAPARSLAVWVWGQEGNLDWDSIKTSHWLQNGRRKRKNKTLCYKKKNIVATFFLEGDTDSDKVSVFESCLVSVANCSKLGCN